MKRERLIKLISLGIALFGGNRVKNLHYPISSFLFAWKYFLIKVVAIGGLLFTTIHVSLIVV